MDSELARRRHLADAVADPGSVEVVAVGEARALASAQAPAQDTWRLLRDALSGGGLAAGIDREVVVQGSAAP